MADQAGASNTQADCRHDQHQRQLCQNMAYSLFLGAYQTDDPEQYAQAESKQCLTDRIRDRQAYQLADGVAAEVIQLAEAGIESKGAPVKEGGGKYQRGRGAHAGTYSAETFPVGCAEHRQAKYQEVAEHNIAQVHDQGDLQVYRAFADAAPEAPEYKGHADKGEGSGAP